MYRSSPMVFNFQFKCVLATLLCDCGCVCGVQSYNYIGVDGMRELAPALCQLTLLEELDLVRFRNVFSMLILVSGLFDFMLFVCSFIVS